MTRKRNKKNLEVTASDNNENIASENNELNTGEMNSKTIMVAGRFVTVNKGTFKAAMTKERLRRESIRHIEDQIKAGREVDLEEQTILVLFYPAMVACSTYIGKPFTYEEFLNLPELEVNEWYVAVNELNPHWFPSDEKSLSEDELKKNSN